MRDLLKFIRALAVGWVALSIPAVPLGVVALNSGVRPDVGDNALGDLIALGLGIALLVFGAGGLILGTGLAVLAKRASTAPEEIRGTRRTAFAAGLAVAGGEVLISAALGGPLFSAVVLGGAVAIAFLLVSVTSGRRGELLLAGTVSIALLGLGVAPLWVQASQSAASARLRDRAALVPADMALAIDAAARAAPAGWAATILVVQGSNISASSSRDLPASLIRQQLQGLLVVDCAGPDTVEVVTMDEQAATVVIGSLPCRTEPQVLAFAIPRVADDAVAPGYAGPPGFVLSISVAPVPNDGSVDGINRALILVALAGMPQPDRSPLLATFVGAFGTGTPR